MERFEQVVSVAAAAEEGVVTFASAVTVVLMVAAVVTIGALLAVSMWRNKET